LINCLVFIRLAAISLLYFTEALQLRETKIPPANIGTFSEPKPGDECATWFCSRRAA
jgi:hypothetical protein